MPSAPAPAPLPPPMVLLPLDSLGRTCSRCSGWRRPPYRCHHFPFVTPLRGVPEPLPLAVGGPGAVLRPATRWSVARTTATAPTATVTVSAADATTASIAVAVATSCSTHRCRCLHGRPVGLRRPRRQYHPVPRPRPEAEAAVSIGATRGERRRLHRRPAAATTASLPPPPPLPCRRHHRRPAAAATQVYVCTVRPVQYVPYCTVPWLRSPPSPSATAPAHWGGTVA